MKCGPMPFASPLALPDIQRLQSRSVRGKWCLLLICDNMLQNMLETPKGSLLFAVDKLLKEAVDIFIESENWSKARRLAMDGNDEQLADIGNRAHL